MLALRYLVRLHPNKSQILLFKACKKATAQNQQMGKTQRRHLFTSSWWKKKRGLLCSAHVYAHLQRLILQLAQRNRNT